MTLPPSLHQPLALQARELMTAFRFVLVAPSHAGNIGSVVRAMKTMGLSDLVVVNPKEVDFINHPQARALASGASDLLAATRRAVSLEVAVADCQMVVAVSASPREFGPLPGTPGEMAALALQRIQEGSVSKVAMVFGTERTGLLINEMALCQQLISIPADPAYSSLNLSQAAQIVAFSLRQQVMLSALQPSSSAGQPLADHADIERLYTHLEQALVAIGYLDPGEPKRLMPRLRRLLSRTRLEVPEVDLLRGICKQMEKVAASAAARSIDSPATDPLKPARRSPQ